MSRSNCLRLPAFATMALLALVLAGCESFKTIDLFKREPERPEPMQTPLLPPAFPPQDLVGRWGLAAYHKIEDRPRTEVAALDQCRQPYLITLGPTGGVMMHLADQATPTELRLKGAPGNKTYIGPEGEPGGTADREVVSFDGRVLVLHWLDSEVQGRYGNMVYVRCPAEGEKKKPAKPKPKPKPKPKTQT